MAQAVRDGERKQTELTFDEIREESITVQEENRHLIGVNCDVCFVQTLRSVGATIALYLCYVCDKYFCHYCFKGHESHPVIKKSERGGQIKKFLDEMMHESEIEREVIFEKEEVSIIDRVNVKHELDQRDCRVSGISGLNNTLWIVSDLNNSCIKIFSVGSNILQRYIRFGSKTCSVTEIKVKREPTEQVLMPASDFSVTNQAERLIQCLLAVTLPWECRILFIDVSKNPAVKAKSIKTEKHCFSIGFSEGMIFTTCRDVVYRGHRWFVSVMSTDGVTIKNISTDLHVGLPYIAVCPGKFYITDWYSNKVFCMNDEGKLVSHKTIEGSRPVGISVDPDTNKVYVCAWDHKQLYRLDSSLESSESLFDFKSVNLGGPDALYFYRDRLYVGHVRWESTNSNFVNVVKVL